MELLVPLINFVLLFDIIPGEFIHNISRRSGTIKSPQYRRDNGINSTWNIFPPNNTATTLRITHIDIGADYPCKENNRCCANNSLSVSANGTLQVFCGNETIPPISLHETSIKIYFNASKNQAKISSFSLSYTMRDESSCAGYDFQCHDKTKCYNMSNLCDSQFDCADHSDEINCRNCNDNKAHCNDYSDYCFNPITERCDGVLHCPRGEDEQNCTDRCPDQIACKDGNGCYNKEAICDAQFHCEDGSDEEMCTGEFCLNFENYFQCKNGRCIPQMLVNNGLNDCRDSSDENEYETTNIAIYIVLIFLILFLIVSLLTCRWLLTRRDFTRLIIEAPDFPLPPFRGPGDRDHNTCDIQFSQSDFMHGSELYQGFVESRRRVIHNSRRRRRFLQDERRGNRRRARSIDSATSSKETPVDVYRNPSGTAIALAALGIDLDYCIGLDKDLHTTTSKELKEPSNNAITSITLQESETSSSSSTTHSNSCKSHKDTDESIEIFQLFRRTMAEIEFTEPPGLITSTK